MDQGERYQTPKLKKIGDVNELTQAFGDPISGEPNQ